MLGILLGLLSAFLQSCSYLVSARFVRQTGYSAKVLISTASVLMAFFGAAVLPFVAPAPGAPWITLLTPATIGAVVAVASNTTNGFLLKHVDSSRASPLLSLKVPLVALFCMAADGETLNLLQWLGIALVIAAAFLLANAGRRMTLAAWGWLLATCVLFALSDYMLKWSFDVCAPYCPRGYIQYAVLTLCLTEIMSGVTGVAMMLCQPRLPPALWAKHSLPWAALWFSAILLLCVAFTLIGVVQGTIVQCSRGLISVVLGWIVMRAGGTALEAKVPVSVVLRRVLAALLVGAGIAVFKIAPSGL